MMKRTLRWLGLAGAVVTLLAASRAAQEEPASGPRVVEDWFEAVNALDGSPESVERLLAFYHPDAQQIQGPTSDRERGTVTFDGTRALETMARRLGERYERIQYRIEVVTANEVSRRLFHRADGPWGGESLAVQFWAAYTRREDGRRFAHPGAAFFQLEGGKIARLRLYAADGERSEVESDP